MKKLQETTGFLRIHEIVEFYQVDSNYFAVINIIREGIDGTYLVEIPESCFNKNDETIEYLKSLPIYANFEII